MYKIMKLYKIRLQRDFLKLVANDQSDQRFLLTSIFSPLALSASDLRLCTFIKSKKMCIKSEIDKILFKLAANDHSDEAFLLTSKLWP